MAHVALRQRFLDALRPSKGPVSVPRATDIRRQLFPLEERCKFGFRAECIGQLFREPSAKEHHLEVEHRVADRRQVAELLKISLPTLKKRTDDGVIHCTRIGRRVLFDRAQIDALLQSKGVQN